VLANTLQQTSMLIGRLPDCVLSIVFECAHSRALIRRVSRRWMLHVDRWLLPSARVPLLLTVPLNPRMGVRSAWEAYFQGVGSSFAHRWDHRSIRLVSPPLACVPASERRPARLSAWPTLINCLRAAVATGVSRCITAIEIEFAAPFVDKLDEASLLPFGVLTVTGEEVSWLLSWTSLRSFVVRAAACDRTTIDQRFTALHVLLERIGLGLCACQALRSFELIDITPRVYGTRREQRKHALSNGLLLATRLVRGGGLDFMCLEGITASAAESRAFWEALGELEKPLKLKLVDSIIGSFTR
jgi:hypothetical protein